MCLGFQEMFYSLRSNHGKYLFGSCEVQRGDRKICRFQNGESKHMGDAPRWKFPISPVANRA